VAMGVDMSGGRSLTRYLQHIRPLEQAQLLLGGEHIRPYYHTDAPEFLEAMQRQLTGAIRMKRMDGDLHIVATASQPMSKELEI